MPITPPCANVDSSPVWEPRAPAVGSGQTQQPNTQGTSGKPTQGGLSPLRCHIPDTRQQENSSARYCCSAFPGRRDLLAPPDSSSMRCWSYSETVMQHAGQPPCSLPVSCETKPTLKHRVSHNSSAQLSLVQDGIYALGKGHMRSTPSLRSFSNVAFEMHKVTIDWTNLPAMTPLVKTQYCADCSLNCDYWGYIATLRLVAE